MPRAAAQPERDWRARGLFLGFLGILALFPLLSSCSGLFYYPSRIYYVAPQRLGYSGEQIRFSSLDGTELYAWHFPARGLQVPKGTIVQFHGNAQNMTSHYLSLIWLVDRGYELFTFDYRGYGKSEGSPSQEGTYEDGLAALRTAWDLHERTHSPRFIVYGQSLGGAIATRALADFEHRDQVSLLVLDSTFMSYREVAFEKLSSSWPLLLLSPLAWVLVSDRYSAEAALKSNPSRTLVIHDIRDPVVPYIGAEEFYLKIRAPKELWTLNDGLHAGVFVRHAPYREKFVALLDSLATDTQAAAFPSGFSRSDSKARASKGARTLTSLSK